LNIANKFQDKWNFPNCIGALDGKHVTLRNYKNSFSIVLMALVDADYKFVYADVGANGRIGDGGVFRNCSLSAALETNSLNVPAPRKVPKDDLITPFVIVADDAFPLKENILKPFSRKSMNRNERIFNYRLSRARRVVENAFDILSNRFRVFHTSITLGVENAVKVVQATLVLHNFLRERATAREIYTPATILDQEDTSSGIVHPGSWRAETSQENMQPISQQGSNRYADDAKRVRESLCQYFNNNGKVEWQDRMI
jgi:hypothetical protein